MYQTKVVCIMTRNTLGSAAARRAAYRLQLTAALLLVCRNIRRLQTSPEARAACDEVVRGLRAMARTAPGSPKLAAGKR
jgi:hypothetical protein